MRWTRQFVSLGPRPAGSQALRQQSELIVGMLEGLMCRVEVDTFVAATPVGHLAMRNIIARFGPDKGEPVIVVSGHYDTHPAPGFRGANDGGSSAGFLVALAERLSQSALGPVWLAFFDGEESTIEWRDGDHTYGSRRIASRWAGDGTAKRIRALINVDMIGDADLELLYEGNSTATLRETVWSVADDLGYQGHFGRRLGYVEDDHIPFLRAGIPSVNLIDFNYGPGNGFWHTEADTMDKLSPLSFAVTLHVVETTVKRLLQE